MDTPASTAPTPSGIRGRGQARAAGAQARPLLSSIFAAIASKGQKLDVWEKLSVNFESLKKALAARPRRSIERPKAAAVLVPIVDDGGPLRMLLTRRTETLPTHKGHVAFPGGMIEAEDADAAVAALREAEEEVGLDRASVEVLGWLDDFVTVYDDTTVTPIVGLVSSLPELRPDPKEVARIFSIPLQTLLSPASWRVEEASRGKFSWPMPFCDYDGEVLWGLTAYIAVHLLEFWPEGPPLEIPHHLIK